MKTLNLMEKRAMKKEEKKMSRRIYLESFHKIFPNFTLRDNEF